MDSKLTLKLNKEVIEQAKAYAASHNRSLSRLIESYLRTLTREEPPQHEVGEPDISPFVKSMRSGVKLPADHDDKRERTEYLKKKYR